MTHSHLTELLIHFQPLSEEGFTFQIAVLYVGGVVMNLSLRSTTTLPKTHIAP